MMNSLPSNMVDLSKASLMRIKPVKKLEKETKKRQQ
jgi:hypothetical protein